MQRTNRKEKFWSAKSKTVASASAVYSHVLTTGKVCIATWSFRLLWTEIKIKTNKVFTDQHKLMQSADMNAKLSEL